MSETLTIKNFGPIKDITLDLKKVNVFIGDQGTGKSTVAKLLIAIRNMFYVDFVESTSIGGSIEQFFSKQLDLVGLSHLQHQDVFINYSKGDKYFIRHREGTKINGKDDIDLRDKLFYNFNYIPAERAFISNIYKNLFALLETGTELPKLFTRFGDKYLKALSDKEEYDYSSSLGYKVFIENKTVYAKLKSGWKVPLSRISSGEQSMLTLLPVFDFIVDETYKLTNKYGSRELYKLLAEIERLLVIEEPELNCFPSTQNEIVKHIIDRIYLKEDYVKSLDEVHDPIEFGEMNSMINNQLVLTTHSPYILSSLNNLMYAYQVGQLNSEETESIVYEKYWLNPDDVSCYMLKDGTCENIMDKELNLIKTEMIDGVSSDLNNQFDKLLDIKIGAERNG